tara:strand:+ start:3552 stop:5552 length:2001 start_codon:yes stop_codon:yes gene_type:complete
MKHLFISILILLCYSNFGVVGFLSAEPSNAKKRTETKRKEKKKNRETREPKKDVPVSFQQVDGLAPKGNPPQIEPNKNFRMSVDQIKSASLWVDRTVGNALIKKGIQPNKQTDDFVFVRRVYLDVAGRIPTDVEARDFLNDKDPDKRRKLVDQLLVSDGYRSHLFNWMADLLRHRGKLRRSNFNHYERWLKDQIAQNSPWDEMVYAMLTAEGTLANSGPTGYLLRDPGMPLDNLSNTLNIFLSANVSCAQCHDHPLADWTQREFYELAAFFGATDVSDRDPRKVGNKLKLPDGSLSKQDVASAVAQNLARVHTKSSQTLKFPDDYAYSDVEPGSPVDPLLFIWGDEELTVEVDETDPGKLRENFAEWLTHKKNPRFAIAIANRLWKRFFGLGVQEPLEDLDDLTKASNPELLQLLGKVMVAADFDLREFQRVILNSKAYQAVSSVTPSSGDSENYLFPGPILRRMSAEQAWDSILALVLGTSLDDYKVDRSNRVTRYDFPYEQMNPDEVREKVLLMKKNGYLKSNQRIVEADFVDGKRPIKMNDEFLLRASELSQPAPDNHFLRMFGQSSRDLVNDSSVEGSIPQSLMLMNGGVQNLLYDREARLSKMLKRSGDFKSAVQFLFLSFFCRPPTPDEMNTIEQAIAEGMKKEDLTWALFNSTEFLFVQ